MRKQLFSAALAALCLTGTATAQEPTIEWTRIDNSLGTIAPSGIQMHGTAALDIGGTTYIYAFGGNRFVEGDSPHISYTPLSLEPEPQTGTWAHTTYEFNRGEHPTSGNIFVIDSAYIERHAHAFNGRLYLVGGTHNTSGGGSPLNQIRVFEPTATGDILEANPALGYDGAADGVTPSLSASGALSVIDQDTGYLYVMGGSTTSLDVRRFTIDPSTGDISDYQLLPEVLAYPPYFSSGAQIVNGYLYVISANQAADRGKVQYAPINPDGTLGVFQVASAILPEFHVDGGSAVLNDELYVIAGHNGGNTLVTDQVRRAIFGANGDITSWYTEPALPGPWPHNAGVRRVGAAALPNDQGIVIMGGRTHDSVATNDYLAEHVWVATPINASVDEWSLY